MGILIATVIILLWVIHLIYSLLFVEPLPGSPWMWLHIAIQSYLYTGLFITGHDAMHALVAKNKRVNELYGHVSTFLFAGMNFGRLRRYHWAHHRAPGEAEDPDYAVSTQNFWLWWFSFMRHYVTIWQLLIMAVMYNVLGIWVNDLSLLLFWITPAFVSTLQLFYFGTFLPHRLPHTGDMMPHRARTQRRNHLWAMLSCYFFGYHYEHHEYPRVPWWQLYRMKKA